MKPPATGAHPSVAAAARRTAVVGVGNEFRRDDGVGWAAVAMLRARAARRPLPQGTVLAQCDGDPGRLLDLWTDTGLVIIVDACSLPSSRPGRTHRWDAADGGTLLPEGPGRHSTHGLGVAAALRLGAALGRGPGRLIVYAVEGGDHSTGLGLTPEVAAAVPGVVRRIEADLEGHDAAVDGTGTRSGPPGGTRRTRLAGRRPRA